MPTVANNSPRKDKASKHPLDRKFASVEEAAQAKTDYVWNTVLKNVDWKQFDQTRKKSAKSE